MAEFVKLNERAVTVNRAAELTGYSVAHIYRLVREHKIPFHKRSGKSNKGAVRFFESELENWIKSDWGFSPAEADIHAKADEILAKSLEE